MNKGMEDLIIVNSFHLSYLRPLLKWRIMDVKSLMLVSEVESHYHNFYRIIRHLESKKVLKGFRDLIQEYARATEGNIKEHTAVVDINGNLKFHAH